MSPLRFPQINQVAVAGRLTHDPEFRVMESGKAMTNFSMAANANSRDRRGEWQQDTTFVPVVAWDKLAEHISQHLHKGSSAFVIGRLKSRKYETRDGNRTVLEVVARSVQFLDKPDGGNSQKLTATNEEESPPF